jgi:hypothetical protein
MPSEALRFGPQLLLGGTLLVVVERIKLATEEGATLGNGEPLALIVPAALLGVRIRDHVTDALDDNGMEGLWSQALSVRIVEARGIALALEVRDVLVEHFHVLAALARAKLDALLVAIHDDVVLVGAAVPESDA